MCATTASVFKSPPRSCCLSAAATTFEAAACTYLATVQRADPRSRRVILSGHVYPPNVSRTSPSFRAAALAEGVGAMTTTDNPGAHRGCVNAATAEFEAAAGAFLGHFSGVDPGTGTAIYDKYTSLYDEEIAQVHVTFLAASLAHVVNLLARK